MALIKQLKPKSMRNTVHDVADASFSIFEDEAGLKYLQIDTYGSRRREMPGKKSQSIQFGPEGMRRLNEILKSF